MGITVELISRLRSMTGAGMMDCKKALTESNGDIDEAIQILRKKGLKVAASRCENSTNEGRVICIANNDKHYGIIFSVNCETDFVADSDVFVSFCESLENLLSSECVETIDDLNNSKINSLTVNEYMVDLMGKVGEKIILSNYCAIHDDYFTKYIHNGNKLGVLLATSDLQDCDKFVANNICMQIAAMKPLGLRRDMISPDIINKEREVAEEQTKAAPNQDIANKMINGRLEKFYKEVVLLEQPFIKDDKISVEKYLKNYPKIDLHNFKRVSI